MIDCPGSTGLAVLAADRSVSFADESAGALLDCAPAECAERLRPAFGSLPAAGSAVISLATGGPSDPDTISRKLRIEAHALARGAGWLLLIHDAAQREAFESMLADSVRARLWARLRPAMYHDFKAPIQSMLWSIEILEKSTAGADAEERRHASIGVLRKEVASLQLHLHDLLEDIAPIESERVVIDTGELLLHAAHVTRSEAGLYGVEVDVEAPERQLYVQGQRGAIREALLCILFASLDRLRDGGSMTLRASRQGKRIVLLVEGKRTDGAADERSATSELPALQIADRIARAHGGRLTVSRGGTATRFTLELPACDPPGA